MPAMSAISSMPGEQTLQADVQLKECRREAANGCIEPEMTLERL
jgi:hypothetical protein